MEERETHDTTVVKRSGLRSFARIVVFILLIPVFLSLIIQIPIIQKWTVNYFTTKIEKQIDRNIDINKVYLNPFKGLEVDSLFVEGQSDQDTLLFVPTLRISLAKNLFSLFDNNLGLNEVEVDGTKIYVVKQKGETKNNLTLLFEKLSPDKVEEKKSSKGLSVGVAKIILKNSSYNVLDLNTNSTTKYQFADASILFKEFNPAKGVFDIVSFKAVDPYVEIIKRGNSVVEKQEITIEGDEELEEVVEEISKSESRIYINSFQIANGTFSYRDETARGVIDYQRSINLKDFQLTSMHLNVDSLLFDPSWEVSGDLVDFNFKDDKGFNLNKISSNNFIISQEEITFPEMILETEATKMKSDFSFLFDGYSDFEDFVKKVYIRSNFDQATLALEDLIHFVPALNKSEFFVHNRRKKIILEGNYRGVVNKLSGRNVRLRINNSLNFEGNFGTINLTEGDRALVNLKIEKLNSSVGFLNDLIPAFTPPENFYKLGNIDFTGRYDGYFNDFVAVGNLYTALGNASMDMRLDVKDGNELANYSGELRLIDFDLQKWSDSDKVEKVTFYTKVNEGKGLTLNSVIADLEANVESIVYNGYSYTNLKMDGKVEKNQFNGVFNISDENINLEFTGDVSYIDSILMLDVNADIKNLDLQKLNFTDNKREISGKVNANVQGSDPTNLVGVINGNNITINADELYTMDTFSIYSHNLSSGKSKLDIFWDDGVAKLEGIYTLGDIVPQVKSMLKKNYPYHTRDLIVEDKILNENNFLLNLRVDDTRNLLGLAGYHDLRIKDFRAKGNVDSNRENFNFDGDKGYFGYKENQAFNVDLVAGNRGENGFFVLNIDSSSVGGRTFNPLYLETDLDKDSILFAFSTEEIFDSLEVVSIQGSLTPHERGYNLNIKDNEWLMLGSEWSFYIGNEIIIGKKYLDIRDLVMSDGYREIEIKDIDKKGLNIDLKGFDFLILNGIIDYDKIDFTGEGNATVRVENIFGGDSYIQAEVLIDDFRLNDDRYGILNVSFDRGADKSYKALVTLSKDEQAIKANVVYDAEKDEVNGSLRARAFPLHFFELILQTGISETQGYADVDADIFGKSDDLKVLGDANLHGGGVKIDYLGTSFFFDKQTMMITENYLDLNGGVLTDAEGNVGYMTGGIRHNLFRDFRLNAVLKAENAVVINTTKKENPLYYGYGKGKVEARFTGGFDKANIDVTAVTSAGTKMNLPVEYAEITYDESFIKFVNREELLNPKEEDKIDELKIEGLNVEMNLQMTEDAEVNIIFNERIGDIIRGTGRGNLQIFAKRTGEFEIFGDYEVDQGEYLFTAYGILAKPFVVRKGGRIKWTGDPIDATLDIIANYEVRSPLDEFLSEFLISAPNDIIIEARQNHNVDLELQLGGTLFNPNVNFDFSFPELTGELNNYAVSKLRSLRTNKIALNRSVAGLLLLGRFLPAGNSNSLSLSNQAVETAASTLSEFIASQASLYVTEFLQEALSDNSLIADIDFEIGLRNNSSIFNQDQRSDFYPDEIEVQVNNRFRFLNQRLSLGVGVNYVRESATGFVNNYYVPDFELKYYLTNDRQFKLRLYGRSDFDELQTARKQKVGFGIGYRTEFGSLTNYRDKINVNSKTTEGDSGNNK